MNFKFTFLKTIFSLLVFIGVDYLLASQTGCLNEIGADCSTLGFMITPLNILYSLIPTIIVYMAWSLFQKK